MGIVKQQTIKGTFYSYLGVVIGFITLIFFQPHALNTEEVGLTGILISYSQMFAQFAILGFNGTGRYFPYFRNDKKNHHGYLFLSCVVALLGFALYVVVAYIFKDDFISQKTQKSNLFHDYYWYLVPLTFFTLFFNVFELYARLLYDTTSSRVLREFTQRLLILFTVVLILVKVVNFHTFMTIWLLANVLPTFLMAGRLMGRGQFSLVPDLGFPDRDLTNKMVSISFFAILTGSAPIIIQNVDKYMINYKYGLSDTGVYTIAAYCGTVITLPARSLYSIAYTMVVDAWKEKDIKAIKILYEKSCINQLAAALFIFILIWANVHNIFRVLPPTYAAGKYVIFFIGLGFLIDSATGINGVIISTSKYFKIDSLFYLGLILVTIVFNLIFIPRYGITGAAIAAALTLLVFNLFRYIFILIAYRMQPFTYKTPLMLLFGVIIYWLTTLIPIFSNFITDGLIRSITITVLFVSAIYFFNLSEDINIIIKKNLLKLNAKK